MASAPDHPLMMASGSMKHVGGPKHIIPDDRTKTEIYNSHVSRVIGAFRICVDKAGRVETYLPLRSTGFASYDQQLVAGMSRWAFEPIVDEGKAIAVCTVVTFIYSQY